MFNADAVILPFLTPPSSLISRAFHLHFIYLSFSLQTLISINSPLSGPPFPYFRFPILTLISGFSFLPRPCCGVVWCGVLRSFSLSRLPSLAELFFGGRPSERGSFFEGGSVAGSEERAMEVYGKCMVAGATNVIFLSSILGREGPIPGHKCDWKCENEHVCGNMYRCKLTGITHICDKNCNQRILYDNHSSLCRVSGQVFPFTPAEEQAVRGVRRKLDPENSPADSCAFKRRRDAQFHPSPFERSFRAVGPICSQIGDGMDLS